MRRLLLPDLLKGFAVFLIIPVHILETFIDFPGRESLIGKIIMVLDGPTLVPVFMIVMGYFVAKNQKSLSQNISRGIKIFFAGFLLNIGLNFNLLLKIKYAGWPYNPFEYIFGVDILYLAGLSIVFLSFLKNLRKNQIWIAFILIFAITGLTGLMNEKMMVTERNYILPFIAGNYSWSYFPIFPWLAYPLSGFVFYHWEEKIRLSHQKQKIASGIILGLIVLLVIFFFKWGVNITINLTEYYHHTFLYSLWAFGIVISWTMLLRFFLQKYPKTRVGDFLMWLGRNITIFYIVQWLIIGNIATEIYQTQNINSYVFCILGAFVLTSGITRLIERSQIVSPK